MNRRSRIGMATGWALVMTSLSATALSHTGWAGNSLWIDLAKRRYVVVLTNRSGDHEKAAKARIELAERVLRETGI